MSDINWLAIIAATLVPTVIGMLYYGPVLGKHWLDSIGKTQEEMTPANPAVTYGLAVVMAFVVSFFLRAIIDVMHRDVMDNGDIAYQSFQTFGHGALHGFFICLSFAAPVLISYSLYHKKSAKNIILNVVFWFICFALMGGIVDAWR